MKYPQHVHIFHEDNQKFGECIVKFRRVKMVWHQKGVIFVLTESELLNAFNQCKTN